MKLEYLHDLTDGGRFKQVISENLVRLFDFTVKENRQLVELIKNTILKGKPTLAVHDIEFVEAVNCQLTLHVAKTDLGIIKTGGENEFECLLTTASFQTMTGLMLATSSGHNWLCDTSENNIDFLYTPGGTW